MPEKAKAVAGKKPSSASSGQATKRKLPANSHASRKKKVKVEKQQDRISFLSLPPEVRNLIYEHAFTRPARIHIAGKSESQTIKLSRFLWKRKRVRHTRRSKGKSHSIPISLLRTCKQVHADARAMLYANHFMVQDMETLAVWLRDLCPGNVACLRRIQLKTEPQSWDPRASHKVKKQQSRYRDVCRKVAKMLSGAEHLESLQMVFHYHHEIALPNLSLRRPGSASVWIDFARKIAEVLYQDFRPIYSQGLTRGRTPEQLCGVLQPTQSNWWSRRSSLTPPQLTAKEAELAGKDVVDHLRLLLKRNLRYRLGPRYRIQNQIS